jgi:hypothetical protein
MNHAEEVMLDDKKNSEFEQNRSVLVEMLPPLWRGLYLGCINEGFTEEDAMRLVCAQILGSASGGIHS